MNKQRPAELFIQARFECPYCGNSKWKVLEELQGQSRIYCDVFCKKSYLIEIPDIVENYTGLENIPKINFSHLNLNKNSWMDINFDKIRRILKLQGYSVSDINKMITIMVNKEVDLKGLNESEILKMVLACYDQTS